jgi:hypothetical protein
VVRVALPNGGSRAVRAASGSDAAHRRSGVEPVLRAAPRALVRALLPVSVRTGSSGYGQIGQEQQACPGEAGFAAANRSVRIDLVYLAVSPSWPNAAAS